MLHAHSLDSISNDLLGSFRKITRTKSSTSSPILDINSFSKFTFFNPSDSTESFEEIILTNKVKLIGILFVHPESKLGKNDIIPRIGQYHHRSSTNTDFFCAGYGAYWPENHFPDQRLVLRLDGVDWLYSDKAFDNIRRELEAQTKWKYDGESELILTQARFNKHKNKPELNFEECVLIKLEQHLKDDGDSSVSSLFEKIFRFGESNKNPSPYNFSDEQLLKNSGESLLSWVLSVIKMEQYYKKNRNLAIHDISKKK